MSTILFQFVADMKSGMIVNHVKGLNVTSIPNYFVSQRLVSVYIQVVTVKTAWCSTRLLIVLQTTIVIILNYENSNRCL